MTETPPVDLDVLRRLDSTQVDHTNQGDSFLRVRSDVNVIASAAADEIERLRAWKAEATEVITQWEQVWEALGCPGRLGDSKAGAVLRMVADDLRELLDSKDQPHEA